MFKVMYSFVTDTEFDVCRKNSFLMGHKQMMIANFVSFVLFANFIPCEMNFIMK